MKAWHKSLVQVIVNLRSSSTGCLCVLVQMILRVTRVKPEAARNRNFFDNRGWSHRSMAGKGSKNSKPHLHDPYHNATVQQVKRAIQDNKPRRWLRSTVCSGMRKSINVGAKLRGKSLG
jgi:hypothetical protein